MRIPKKYWNHNGGTILFGPDGYLYIAPGDGGRANDPDKNGQNLSTIFGKSFGIRRRLQERRQSLRDSQGQPVRELREGGLKSGRSALRNPWRIAFDRETGVLWCGDVGQDKWEEIDLIVRGGNYGWSLREGNHPFGPEGSERAGADRPNLGVLARRWQIDHRGLVYRGKDVPRSSVNTSTPTLSPAKCGHRL